LQLSVSFYLHPYGVVISINTLLDTITITSIPPLRIHSLQRQNKKQKSSNKPILFSSLSRGEIIFVFVLFFTTWYFSSAALPPTGTATPRFQDHMWGL